MSDWSSDVCSSNLQEQTVVVCRGSGHQRLALFKRVGGGELVVAQPQLDILVCRQRVGHGFYAGRVNCLQLFDKAHDAVQFVLGAGGTIWRKLNTREPRDAGYVLFGNGHGFYYKKGFRPTCNKDRKSVV